MVVGLLTEEELDARVLEMLRGLRADHILWILQQLREASLLGVHNKASYLMAVLRNFRDRIKQLGMQAATSTPLITGPAKESIQVILILI